MNCDKVSIIMPNYNCSKFIGEAIKSVIAQQYSNWELIIVDDCSTDESLKVIKEYQAKEKRIILLTNNENKGAAFSRNRAIKEASGRWIALLDSDDVWLPDKLKIQIDFMEKNNAYFTFGAVSFINEEGDALKIKDFVPTKKEYTYKDILKKNDIACLTAVYDTKFLGKIYMPIEAIKREDYACFLDILKQCNGFSIPVIMAKYRIHTSVSSNKFKMIKYTWNVYRRVEKIGFFKSLRLMVYWAINGIVKYHN